MSADNLPTIEYLKQCFRYEDGKLFWLVRPLSHFKNVRGMNVFNARDSGREAGNIKKGRWGDRGEVKLGYKIFKRSRIVWAMHHGRWPAGMVDHINRTTTDDRIENLREADDSQNQWNSGRRKDNTSGIKGVTWNKRNRKWQCYIMARKERFHLGYFDDKNDAYAAYCEAATRMFGEFACDGEKAIVNLETAYLLPQSSPVAEAIDTA